MMIGNLLLLLLLPASLLVSAFCAASETAVFSLTWSDRQRLRRFSPRAAAAVERLVARQRSMLLLVLMLTNLANVLYFVAGSVLERRIVSPVGTAIAGVGMLVAIILCADLLPKLLARTMRIGFCMFAARPLDAMVRAGAPLIGAVESFVVEPLLRLVRPSGDGRRQTVTEEELAALLELSARSGDIAPDDERLLSDLVELRSTRVRDVMTPRIAMPWVEESAPPAKVKEVIRESDLSWVPVFRRSSDGEPLGLMEVRRYLPAAEGMATPEKGDKAQPRAVVPGSFIRPALFLPERARLDQALELFQGHKAEMALCVDEFGAVVGMVRAQEVVDRLVVGESGAPTAGMLSIARVAHNRWVVPGRLPVREFREFFERSLGTRLGIGAGVSTVAGLLVTRLGKVPKAGDAIRIGNVELRVESMSGRAVESVAISVLDDGRGAGVEKAGETEGTAA